MAKLRYNWCLVGQIAMAYLSHQSPYGEGSVWNIQSDYLYNSLKLKFSNIPNADGPMNCPGSPPLTSPAYY